MTTSKEITERSKPELTPGVEAFCGELKQLFQGGIHAPME